MEAGVEERRRQQVELYGESVETIAQRAHSVLGLDLAGISDVVGLSVPMLTALLTGERVRIGNPVAIARLIRLREFTGQVLAGEAGRDEIPLTLAQIRASETPAPPSPAPPSPVPPSPVPHSGPLTAAWAPGWGAPSLPAFDASDLALSQPALSYARTVVARHVRPTPAYRWPLLERFTHTETWVKHENHTPTGAFKVRGGLNFIERLRVGGFAPAGLVCATRGNHGQSIAFAGGQYGLPVVIVVPEGNSPDKNAAMEGFGAQLVVHGRDFDEAKEYAAGLAAERGLLFAPSFHPWLVEGVATYAAELHEAVPGLEIVYVPIGLGSGICANIAVRDLLGLRTEVVGVVAERAPAYALSFERGEPVATPSAATFADGVAVRTPDPAALSHIRRGASRVIRVSEEQIAEAMAMAYRTTHNLAEPAGAVGLAGLLADVDRAAGKRVAVVQTGGNCDRDVLRKALEGVS